MSRLYAQRIVCVAAAAAGLGAIQAGELILNGGFETGTLANWSAGYSPDYASGGRPYGIGTGPADNGWAVLNTAVDVSGISTPMAPISGYSAFNGFDGGVVDRFGNSSATDLVFFLRQAVSISPGYGSAVLSFDFDIDGGAQSASPRFFEVELLDSMLSRQSLLYWFIAFPNGSPTAAAVPRTHVSLSVENILNALPGGDYYLNFREVIPDYYTGPASLVLDNISLQVTAPVPEPSTYAAIVFAGMVAGAGLWRRFRKGTSNP